MLKLDTWEKILSTSGQQFDKTQNNLFGNEFRILLYT